MAATNGLLQAQPEPFLFSLFFFFSPSEFQSALCSATNGMKLRIECGSDGSMANAFFSNELLRECPPPMKLPPLPRAFQESEVLPHNVILHHYEAWRHYPYQGYLQLSRMRSLSRPRDASLAAPSLIFPAVENIGGGSPLRGYDVLAAQQCRARLTVPDKRMHLFTSTN